MRLGCLVEVPSSADVTVFFSLLARVVVLKLPLSDPTDLRAAVDQSGAVSGDGVVGVLTFELCVFGEVANRFSRSSAVRCWCRMLE